MTRRLKEWKDQKITGSVSTKAVEDARIFAANLNFPGVNRDGELTIRRHRLTLFLSRLGRKIGGRFPITTVAITGRNSSFSKFLVLQFNSCSFLHFRMSFHFEGFLNGRMTCPNSSPQLLIDFKENFAKYILHIFYQFRIYSFSSRIMSYIFFPLGKMSLNFF